jgi:hypothetical protein
MKSLVHIAIMRELGRAYDIFVGIREGKRILRYVRHI